jgi:hypothetical protein
VYFPNPVWLSARLASDRPRDPLPPIIPATDDERECELGDDCGPKVELTIGLSGGLGDNLVRPGSGADSGPGELPMPKVLMSFG